MRPAQEALAALIERIFADGVVTPAEKVELKALYRDKGLTVPEVRHVFTKFLKDTWGEVLADGVVTKDERTKLNLIVSELMLPADALPPEMGPKG